MTKKEDSNDNSKFELTPAEIQEMRSEENRSKLMLAIDTAFTGLEMLGMKMPDKAAAALAMIVYAQMTKGGFSQEQVWQQMTKSHGVALERCGVNIIGNNNAVVAGDMNIDG